MAIRTKPGVCARKRRYRTERDARAVALAANVPLRPYRCELCRDYHLTGRTKGMRSLRPLE
jgi:hypothetical protein